jgi:LysM repeat protein
MTNFVSATYYPDERIAEYVTVEGRRLMRRGGSLCWLLNNCGNLVSPMKEGKPAPKKTKNYVGFARAGAAGHHFFIFKSYEAGREEVKAWFKRRGTLTIAQCIEAYAPPHENNTAKYVADVESLSGLASTREIASLSEADLDKLVGAVERKEGFHQNANTRQEKWIDSTIITATNGSAPIAGFELQLESAGKTKTIKANEFGQFRPVPHIGKTPTIVKAPKPDGTWEKLLELTDQTTTRIYSLVVDWFSVTATMQSTQAPSQAKLKKNPIQYRVQPGDRLHKIAKNFHTNVAELKAHNQLQGDSIFPEQVLWIYGKGTDLGPKMPRKQAIQDIRPMRE